MFDAVRLPNTALARVSNSPERSIATIVFSNVGAAAFFAIASISLRCSAMPASKRRLEVLVLDLVERRQLIGQGARARERIV